MTTMVGNRVLYLPAGMTKISKVGTRVLYLPGYD